MVGGRGSTFTRKRRSSRAGGCLPPRYLVDLKNFCQILVFKKGIAMKVEKCNESGCSLELNTSLDAEESARLSKKALDAVCARASLPGFRRGKVPRAIVEKRFAEAIAEATADTALRETIEKAIEDAGLKDRLFRVAEVKDVNCKAGEPFSYTASVELKPEFSLPDMSKLKLEAKAQPVTDEDVDGYLAHMRKRAAKFEKAGEDYAAAEGDFVSIDYAGKVDGRDIAEIVPGEKAIASGSDFWIGLEEGAFLPEIVEALKGMKAGESKTVEVSFPENDAAPEAIRGAKAVYEVALKTVRQANLPDDNGLAEAMGAKSFGELKEQARETISKSRERADRDRLRDEAVEFLLKDAAFAVPESVLKAERNIYLANLRERAQSSGLPADYFEKNRDKIMADAEAAALRRVRLSWLLAKAAAERKIAVGDMELQTEIMRIGMSAGLSYTVALERVRKNGQIGRIRENLLESKTLDGIVDEALAR